MQLISCMPDEVGCNHGCLHDDPSYVLDSTKLQINKYRRTHSHAYKIAIWYTAQASETVMSNVEAAETKCDDGVCIDTVE
jgi:hypothetical protein